MKKFCRMVAVILCMTLILGFAKPVFTYAAPAAGEEAGTGSNAGSTGEGTGGEGSSGDEAIDTSDMISGADSDIAISGLSVTGSQAGKTIKVKFTVKANSNSKRYFINGINKVCPVVSEGFPFETTDEAYKIINGSGNTLECSYSFVAKDNLETAYYPVSFMVVYGRKSTTIGTDAYADKEYFVTKNISIKLVAKKTAATTETASADGDVSLVVKRSPKGSYGQNTTISFTAVSKNCKITKVTPVIAENFPFETQGDAYKTVSSKGTKSLPCNYSFKVRTDVATGYQPVSFSITYIKNGQSCTVTKSLNISLTGKKEKNGSGGGGGAKSTPRLMVTGYNTNTDKIYPGESFHLTLHIKNNAKRAVSNIKLTLSTAEGEFLPTDGASTAYIESVAAGATKDIDFDMNVAAGLSAKPYQITVKSEYEDSSATAFTAEDSISIPISLKDRIKITEMTPPEDLTLGGSSELSFTINNMGAGSLNNVSVICEGKEFEAEEAMVGNIAAGASGYASVALTGTKMTEDVAEDNCKIIITYENASGETVTYEEKTTVLVMEEMPDIDESNLMEEETKPKANPFGWVLLLVIVVAVIVAIVVVKKRKKMRKIREEEELMDDDLL